jgi:hypothetical protein
MSFLNGMDDPYLLFVATYLAQTKVSDQCGG